MSGRLIEEAISKSIRTYATSPNKLERNQILDTGGEIR